MTELDKAVRRFTDLKRRNIAFISHMERVTRPEASEKLFTIADRRLKASQSERKLQEGEARS